MGVLDDLGQTIIPNVFTALNNAGLTETMDVLLLTRTKDTGGAAIVTVSTAYYSIPVAPPEARSGWKRNIGEQPKSVTEYLLTFPTHDGITPIDIDPVAHRLKVLVRGNELERTYRITSLNRVSGVIFEAVCELEN